MTKHERYNRSEKGRARYRRYRETDKGRRNERVHILNRTTAARVSRLHEIEEELSHR